MGTNTLGLALNSSSSLPLAESSRARVSSFRVQFSSLQSRAEKSRGWIWGRSKDKPEGDL